ncbi:hypothetical protein D3C85_1532790 [compost metagenome]
MLLFTATLGEETGNDTVLDVAVLIIVRPSGGKKVYVAVPVLLMTCGLGKLVMSTEKETVLELPAAIVPALMPVIGSTPGCGVPSTIALFSTKEVPAGIVSVTITVASRLPVFVTRML